MLHSSRSLFSVTLLPRVVILGVAGGIGTGKSVRCAHLLKLSQARARLPMNSFEAHSISADRIGHEVYTPGKPCYYAIIEAFGKGVLQDVTAGGGGSTTSLKEEPFIDRRKLGDVVFANPHSKEWRQLNNLCWPHIHDAVEQEIDEAAQAALANNKNVLLILLEAALLIESSLLSLCDDVWFTTCEKRVAVRRVMERNNMSEAKATARVEGNLSLEKKLDFLRNIKFRGEVKTFDTTDEALEKGLKRVTIAFDDYWRRKLGPLQWNPDAETDP